ncbi:DUF348 domain-containing protein [Oceanobacillus sp. 143]|uniref:G5 domain-containing protein n=1 Tax=Oceanobacillus zhaokaii TaxID=2052660 RepID=A0A345PC03_9BACI|nr:G5 and 3D domain-containing protein [Oceanobacillus zhaokaii]AXI07533.1 hypothetical protein CUC15_00245 [Oceanobacillus zhaokaii]QGS67761.1 DUF348 domain-containing protein [Oceanobacillus sp. 143]
MRIISKLLPASKMKLVISVLGVFVLVLFSGLVLFEATKAEVVISNNGEKQTIDTHTNTVGELLNEVGIVVSEHDILSHNKDGAIKNGMTIDYESAKQIILTIDGKDDTYYTTADTVGDFLNEQNLSFAAHDIISHKTTEPTTDGLNIDVTTAYQITIQDGAKNRTVWTTTGGSVFDLLNKNKIRLNEHDRIQPSAETMIDNKTEVSIVRVNKVVDEVHESVSYSTEKQQDNTLVKGEEKVITQGQDGIVVKKYNVTTENGKEVSRELVNEEVKKPSTNRVVAVGTKEPEAEQGLVTLANTSSGSNHGIVNTSTGGKTLTMTASAFTSECSGCSGYTATGINLNANPNMKVIAVDPNVIPLGSRVWIEGYGVAIAGDTGGAINGNRIDVHVPTKADAYSWGVKTVQVKILDS